MRAAVYRNTGAARDVLRVEDVAQPQPGPGEVLVRVHASGVNPTDFKTRAGATARPIDEFQIPHQDGAGVIEGVGEGVDQARVGERVWVWLAAHQRRWGTAAEWTVVPSRQAGRRPGLTDPLVHLRDQLDGRGKLCMPRDLAADLLHLRRRELPADPLPAALRPGPQEPRAVPGMAGLRAGAVRLPAPAVVLAHRPAAEVA